jgi:hypothetical protein
MRFCVSRNLQFSRNTRNVQNFRETWEYFCHCRVLFQALMSLILNLEGLKGTRKHAQDFTVLLQICLTTFNKRQGKGPECLAF